MSSDKLPGERYVVVVPLDDGFEGRRIDQKIVSAVPSKDSEPSKQDVPPEQVYAATRMLLSHFLTRMVRTGNEFLCLPFFHILSVP